MSVIKRLDVLLTKRRIVGYSGIFLTVWLSVFFFLIVLHLNGDRDLKDSDFLAFYTAGRMVMDGESASLYDPAAQKHFQDSMTELTPDELSLFLNPPAYALIMIPFSSLPYKVAIYLWRLLSLAIIGLCSYFYANNFKLDINWKNLTVIILASFPAFINMMIGQNASITLGLYTLALFYLGKDKEFCGGTIIGLGAIKPQLFWLMPILFLIMRKWRVLSGWFLGVGTILFFSLMVSKPAGILAFMELIQSDLYHQGISSQLYKMYSLSSFFALLTENGAFVSISSMAFALGAIIMLSLEFRGVQGGKVEWGRVFAFVILATVLVSPHLFYYDLLLLAIPFMVAYSWMSQLEKHEYQTYADIRISMAVLYVIIWISFVSAKLIHIQIAIPFMVWLSYLLWRHIPRYYSEMGQDNFSSQGRSNQKVF